MERAVNAISDRFNATIDDAVVYNAEANWHGEAGHWSKGGKGEPYKSSLGSRQRSDLLRGVDNLTQHVGGKTDEAIRILESGQAGRLKRAPIRGPSLLSPIDEETGLLAGFLMPK
jgi:hypothetical protein